MSVGMRSGVGTGRVAHPNWAAAGHRRLVGIEPPSGEREDPVRGQKIRTSATAVTIQSHSIPVPRFPEPVAAWYCRAVDREAYGARFARFTF
jgi:hypothetical protein